MRLINRHHLGGSAIGLLPRLDSLVTDGTELVITPRHPPPAKARAQSCPEVAQKSPRSCPGLPRGCATNRPHSHNAWAVQAFLDLEIIPSVNAQPVETVGLRCVPRTVEGRAVRSILKSRVVTGTMRSVLIGFAERNKSRPWTPGHPTVGRDTGTGHTESQCRTGGLSSVRRQRACLVTPSQTSEKRKSETLGGGVACVVCSLQDNCNKNRDRTPPSLLPASWATCVRHDGGVPWTSCHVWLVGSLGALAWGTAGTRLVKSSRARNPRQEKIDNNVDFLPRMAPRAPVLMQATTLLLVTTGRDRWVLLMDRSRGHARHARSIEYQG